jgi:enoyl-CoA hydratase
VNRSDVPGTPAPGVDLLIDRESHRADIVLRRPERGNAMTREMARDFVRHLDAVNEDDEVKVVVIRGEGEHLSSGWDPDDAWRQYQDAPGGAIRRHPSQRARLIALDDYWWGPDGLYSRLLHCRKVTITQAVGDCFETGLYLTLCSDLVVASPDARFACPRWQNVGADGDLSLLIATVGLKRAKEMMYGGRPWSASDAHRYGLVDKLSSDPATAVAEFAVMCASIMRDGIVTEKYAVFASLAKMGVAHSFAAATVVSASLSNIHFQPDEYNFLKDVRDNGTEAALARSRNQF